MIRESAVSDSGSAAYWLCDLKEILLVVFSFYFPNYKSADFLWGLKVMYCGHSTERQPLLLRDNLDKVLRKPRYMNPEGITITI